MSFGSFVRKSVKRFRGQGVRVIPSIAAGAITEGLSRSLPIHRFGRRIFEHEWDVLIVLDACRADMYLDVVNDTAESVWSCASSSLEWMEKNFQESYADEMSSTAYITGNPFTENEKVTRTVQNFGILDEVWRYGWDDELGTITPDPIADRVISVSRRRNHKRVIGHFMQPHFPFIGADQTWGHIDVRNYSAPSQNPWDRCKLGEASVSEVKEAYYQNLAFVWPYVQRILQNVSGKVVVTSDHGNALGEGGIWGHRNYLVHPSVRRVPWDEYECHDLEGYDPPSYDRRDGTNTEIEDRLHQLGYI